MFERHRVPEPYALHCAGHISVSVVGAQARRRLHGPECS